MLRDLSLFVREKYGLSDIPFPALTYSFIESYDFWMRIERRLKPGTIINRTGRLMYVIRQADNRGHIVGDPFAGYKVVRGAPARKFLTDDEPTRIIETPLPKRHLYLTRRSTSTSRGNSRSCITCAGHTMFSTPEGC
jgi:hypothetical protein